jgi:predicted nucleotidyltransferase
MNTAILTKSEIKQTFLSHQNTLRTYGVKRLGLFGSYVKDTAHSESDIDLLVELEELSFDRYMELRIFLEDLFQKKIDLVIADSLKPRLRPRIEKEIEYVAGL